MARNDCNDFYQAVAQHIEQEQLTSEQADRAYKVRDHARRDFERHGGTVPPYHDLLAMASWYLTQNRLMRQELVDRAAAWRKGNPERVGGVVMFYQGELQGWVNELRDPHHWAPECLAIDADGKCWVAMGGTADTGAERWEDADE